MHLALIEDTQLIILQRFTNANPFHVDVVSKT
jgi:hypothetical protein